MSFETEIVDRRKAANAAVQQVRSFFKDSGSSMPIRLMECCVEVGRRINLAVPYSYLPIEDRRQYAEDALRLAEQVRNEAFLVVMDRQCEREERRAEREAGPYRDDEAKPFRVREFPLHASRREASVSTHSENGNGLVHR